MTSKPTSLRLPPDIEGAMKELAKEHDRSINSEIVQACRAWMRSYAKESIMVNPKLVQAIRQEVEQAKSEGMDDEDIKWMAAGAAIRFGREQDIIGEAVSDEMNAAIIAAVKQELKK